ncbi:hypothetical protein J6590_090931, partial [Homalodisca vitripennis]
DVYITEVTSFAEHDAYFVGGKSFVPRHEMSRITHVLFVAATSGTIASILMTAFLCSVQSGGYPAMLV